MHRLPGSVIASPGHVLPRLCTDRRQYKRMRGAVATPAFSIHDKYDRPYVLQKRVQTPSANFHRSDHSIYTISPIFGRNG